MDWSETTKRFLMGEAFQKSPSLKAYIQSLQETLDSLSPRTKGDARKLEVAKSHIREVNRQVRRLEENISLLENENKELNERLNILEEGTDG